jgi:16S rRNA (uracil1498-N3)-methyltransferase
VNRFFLPIECFQPGEVIFDTETSHQISRVLRLKPGSQVTVLDGTGDEYLLELNLVEKTKSIGRILSKRENKTEPRVQLTVLVGLTQREKFEWVLQKCTEIGATAFTPVITSRSIVQDIRTTGQKMDRWQQILKEAAEQSGRARIPLLNPPVLFLQALEQLRGFDLGLVAYENEKGLSIRKALRGYKRESLGILIGPEGGLAEEESLRARQSGIQLVSLGIRTLRMETAAIVAATLILHQLKSLD